MNVLDAIGNESRRRILELLAKKPCYVSEISYYLGMAPKVVIEHLEKLESAGIVKSVEDGKRRYYFIAKNIHIDVTISPHRFEVHVIPGESSDASVVLKDIESKLGYLDVKDETLHEVFRALRVAEDICARFSLIHGSIVSKLNDLTKQLIEEIEKITSDDLERLTLIAMAKGMRSAFEIAECFKIPYKEVKRALESLRTKGLVRKEIVGDEEIWMLEVS